MGIIAFSPLAQGMLTDRYLEGIPADSRAAKDFYLKKDFINEENMSRIRALNEIAQRRGQKLAQMALAWVLRDPRVTSALIGASSVEQLETNVGALDNVEFTDEELAQIMPNSPYVALLGIELAEVGTDRAVLRLPFREEVVTIADVVHGGAV